VEKKCVRLAAVGFLAAVFFYRLKNAEMMVTAPRNAIDK
jgi:hypothetical protein